MLSRLRRRGAGGHDDRGITLVELVVTMTLMSIVGALSLTWFLGSSKASTQTVESSFTATGPRNALNAWAGLLQVADSPLKTGGPIGRIQQLTDTSISFYADLTNRNTPCASASCSPSAPSLVTLSLTAGRLTQSIASPTVSSSSSASPTVNPSPSAPTTGSSAAAVQLVQVPSGAAKIGDCLFTPATANGTAISGTCHNPTAAALTTVAQVDIDFRVTPSVGPAQTFATSVTVPGSNVPASATATSAAP